MAHVPSFPATWPLPTVCKGSAECGEGSGGVQGERPCLAAGAHDVSIAKLNLKSDLLALSRVWMDFKLIEILRNNLTQKSGTQLSIKC